MKSLIIALALMLSACASTAPSMDKVPHSQTRYLEMLGYVSTPETFQRTFDELVLTGALPKGQGTWRERYHTFDLEKQCFQIDGKISKHIESFTYVGTACFRDRFVYVDKRGSSYDGWFVPRRQGPILLMHDAESGKVVYRADVLPPTQITAGAN